jgi:hypothetical protein
MTSILDLDLAGSQWATSADASGLPPHPAAPAPREATRETENWT